MMRLYAIIIGTVTLPAALLFNGYTLAEIRYLERHATPSNYDPATLGPGDIIAVSGVLRARPLQLPPEHPQFPRALIVVRQEEEFRYGPRTASWKFNGRAIWISTDVRLGDWSLDQLLVYNAGLPRFRRSLCDDEFQPPPGWVADCTAENKSYAYRVGNNHQRLFYAVAEIPTEPVTILAAVSETKGELTAIQHKLLRQDENLAMSESGGWRVEDLLASRKARALKWVGTLAAASLAVAWAYMFVMLRRTARASIVEALSGGIWRAGLIMVPYGVILWPFEAWGYVAMGFTAMAFSGLIALMLWFQTSWRA
ncbi:MAG TPA: hypothetical protein VG742_21260 [Dongiaceae bacterium]|nr:hypothetical protein [Dongiaceae bacterium]